MRSTEIDRRNFLAAGAAGAFSLFVPISGRADQRPAYVAARREADGSFAAVAIDEAGELLFKESLDGRGHDIALSPDRKLAVFFARRPGRFALVVDLERRAKRLAFTPPEGHHFYGHGFFSPDGKLLFATENGAADETGALGIYDVAAGFVRVGAWSTGGIGPHEALLLPDRRTVVIANGGMQYQGPPTDQVPLVARHKRGGELIALSASPKVYGALRQYVGSVSANADGSLIATTSPRGGIVIEWDVRTGNVVSERRLDDVCGVAPEGSGFLVSDGFGGLYEEEGLLRSYPQTSWDNHLRRV